MKRREIYLDYAATTPVDPRVARTVADFWGRKLGNPSSAHFSGRAAKVELDRARQTAADFFGAGFEEVVFTAGATESINLAHKGLAEGLKQENGPIRIITTKIEHKAVLETCRHLQKLGWAATDYLGVSRSGRIDPAEIEGLVRPETRLVSIGFVNNELGTVQPIGKVGKLLRKLNRKRQKNGWKKIYFHSDITQAVGHLEIKMNRLGLDLASFSGHKIYAPKGVGGLFVRNGTLLLARNDGGGQEEGRRSGTENMGGIVGLAAALKLAAEERKKEQVRLKKLKKRLIDKVLVIGRGELLGDPAEQAAHIVPFWVKGADGNELVMALSENGIAVSAGSACSTGRVKTSHVLLAAGRPGGRGGFLRFSLGRWTTAAEVDLAVEGLKKLVL